jgi:hypothetical protein
MTTTGQYLTRLGELLHKAQSTSNPEIAAHHIAQIQRLSGHALRASVGDCLDAGADWQWIAACAQTPPGTLQQQYERGGRVVVHDPCTPTEAIYEIVE